MKLFSATAPYAAAVAAVDQAERERQERVYWTQSPDERPGAESFQVLTNQR